MSDRDFICRIRSGDQLAFTRLVEKNQNFVYYLAYSILGSVSYIDDAVQEVWVAVFRDLRKLKNPDCFPLWLETLGRRHLIKFREKQRTCLYFEQSIDPTDLSHTIELRQQEIDHSTEPSGIIGEAIERLPIIYHKVVELYLDGLSHKEIAEVLDVPLTTAQARLRNAKRLLKRSIDLG